MIKYILIIILGFLMIQDQGLNHSCASFATTGAMEIVYNNKFYFSDKFVRDRFPDQQEGQRLTDILDGFKNVGCLPEKYQPKNSVYTDSLMKIAGLYKIKNYYRIKLDLNSLQTALYKYNHIIISLPINSNENKFWIGDCFQDNHAVLIVAGNDTCFKFRNSWGLSYWDKGYGYLSYSDIGYINEAYSIEKQPNDNIWIYVIIISLIISGIILYIKIKK